MRSRHEVNLGRHPRLMGSTVYLLASMLGIGLAWSYFTVIDVIVRAPGIVRPDGEVLRITSQVAGTVEGVHIREGDTVHTGDVLIRLDDRQIRFEHDAVQLQIELLQEQIQNIDRKIRDAISIHTLEVRKLEMEIAIARQDLNQRQQEHRAQMDTATLRLARAEDENATYRRLLEEGLVSRQDSDRIATEYRLAQARLEEVIHRSPSRAALNSLLEAGDLIDAEFASLESDRRAEAIQVEAQLTDLRSRLERALHDIKRRVIRSPATGQVTLLPTIHPGEQVRAGTLIATLAPIPVRPIVEAEVPNFNAAGIQAGQATRIRIDESKTLDGVVISVSPDARVNESAHGTYRVLIAPDTLDLRLGLALEVRLITRQERIFTLLFDRIERAFSP